MSKNHSRFMLRSIAFSYLISLPTFATSNVISKDENDSHIRNYQAFQNDEERKENFRKNIINLNKQYDNQNSEEHDLIFSKFEELVSQEVQDVLKNMSKTGEPAIILIKGFPVDELGIENKANNIIPIQERLQNKKTSISENILNCVSRIMNYRIETYFDETDPGTVKKYTKNGIHNVAPSNNHKNTQSSRGVEPLYLHTEEAFDDNPPDFLVLSCIYGDPKSTTTFLPVKSFINLMDTELVKTMKKKIFQINSNPGSVDKPYIGKPTALIHQEDDTSKFRLRLYGNMQNVKPAYIEGLSVDDNQKNRKEVEEAFTSINTFFSTENTKLKPFELSLTAGDILVFNNGWGFNSVDGVMHGRGAAIQDNNRWLQRIFLVQKNSIRN